MSRSHQGFTLIEVLVALCIIAIAFGAIYRAQAQGISMTSESRQVTCAGLLAQLRMAGLISSLPQYGLRRGDFGRAYPDFLWEERVTGYKEFGADLRRVQVSVSWGPGDAARTLTLEGYVLEPAPEEAEGDKADAKATDKNGQGQQSKDKQGTGKPGSGKNPSGDEGDEE